MCCVRSLTLRFGVYTKALCSFFLTLLLLLRETVKFPRKAHAAVNEEPILSLSSLSQSVKVRARETRERDFRCAICIQCLCALMSQLLYYNKTLMLLLFTERRLFFFGADGRGDDWV
jgi:hypothetical protein